MSIEVITVLSQAPIAVVIFVAGFYLIRYQDKRERELFKQWQAFSTGQQKSQEKTFKAIQDSNQKMLSKLSTNIEELTIQVAKNTVALLVHDATVRGVNPEVLGTTEQILEKLLNGD